MVSLNKIANTKSFDWNKGCALIRYCSMASFTMIFFSFNFLPEFSVPARYRKKILMKCMTVLSGFGILTALM